MWVEKRTSKTGVISYRYSERYTCPYSGKSKRVSVTYNSNTRQVQKIAQAELLKKIDRATNTTVDETLTFDSVITQFLDSKRAFRKPSTQYSMDNLHKQIIKWFPTDILLCKLNTYIVQTTFDNFCKEYSFNYAKTALSLVRQSLKYAKRMQFISNISFMDDIELQRPITDVDRVKKQRDKFLTKAELKELLALIDERNHHVALLCEFQALTGLRFGEMIALRTQDYDIAKGEIDINATLSTRGSLADPAMRLPPKNIHSIRKVTLDARATQIINHFITANQARRLWKSKFLETDYIFVTDGGIPYDLHYVNRVIKKIGFYKPVSTHTFRHTHISLLAESNVPLKAIMERVGHNEPRTTLAIYTHVTDEMKKEMSNAISNIGMAISKK